MKHAGYTVHLGGNIGTPLFTRLPEIRPEDMAVLELSSFQLHSMNCHPDVAVITNLAPNHLDVHSDYQDYVTAKQNIYRRQRPDQVLVLNRKDGFTDEFTADAPGKVRYFSNVGPVENGVYVEHDVIFRAINGKAEPILHTSDIRIPGAHNVENYMAAFAALQGLISNEDSVAVAKTFSGVLHAWPSPPIIILGGHDKHIPFDELGDEICLRARAVVLCGETAQPIREAITKSKHYVPDKLPMLEKDDFREAIETAYSMAQPGDLVALSPACSSFDKFKNFAERGNIFRSIVESLPEK